MQWVQVRFFFSQSVFAMGDYPWKQKSAAIISEICKFYDWSMTNRKHVVVGRKSDDQFDQVLPRSLREKPMLWVMIVS